MLTKVKILRNKTIEELESIFNNIKYKGRKVKKNEYLMFRGQEINGLMILTSGKLGAFMPKENGEIHKIETLTEGNIIASAFIFGENNVIPVDLIAEMECQILEIDRENLLKIFEYDRDILVNFLNDISDKTQFLSNKIWKSINNRTIKDKLKDYILENRKDNTFQIPCSIKELAERFNTTRPSLSRVIREMIERGDIEKIGKNRFKILNL